jgi:hypothetical protein
MISPKQILRVCALGVVLLSAVGTAFAQPPNPMHFSNRSLVGSYIMEFGGHSADGDGNGIGILSFDGKGNFSGTDGPNCQISGVYTIIDSDGTGTMNITTDPNVFNTPGCFYHIWPNWTFVIADPSASKVYASGSSAPTDTQSATLTRRWVIQRHTFTAADLSGPYAFLIRSRLPFPVASNGPNPTGAGEVAGVGILHSDGIGNISANIYILQTYLPGPQYSACSGTTSGSYTINADGTGSLRLTPIWVSPNCVSQPPSQSVNLILTPWNLFFDDVTGQRLDLFTNNSVELVEGKLSRQ